MGKNRKKQKNKEAARRELERLIAEAGEQIAPDCPHFEQCGGCSYRMLSYADQLGLKAVQVRQLFEPILQELYEKQFDEVFEGILESPRVLGYRNKMEFSFGDAEKDGPLELGLHARGSFYDIITVEHCQIIDEDMRRILAATLAYFREKKISYFHKRTHEGYLRHLLLRKAAFTGEILVDLVTASASGAMQPEGDTSSGSLLPEPEEILLEGWKQKLLSLDLSGSLAGILHTRNDRISDVVEDQGTQVLHGNGYFYEELLGLRFKISPFSFFQTNSAGAAVLYQKAREYVLQSADGAGSVGKVLFDLYSGTGTIAQILSPAAEKVYGVEIVEEAVAAARENASENGIKNCVFHAGDVLKAIDEIPEKPSFIILDPPRDGIHPKALPKILDFGVPHILYIACKAQSLARDLPVFQSAGYEPVRMCCIDMFPAARGVETVCLLSNTQEA